MKRFLGSPSGGAVMAMAVTERVFFLPPSPSPAATPLPKGEASRKASEKEKKYE